MDRAAEAALRAVVLSEAFSLGQSSGGARLEDCAEAQAFLDALPEGYRDGALRAYELGVAIPA